MFINLQDDLNLCCQASSADEAWAAMRACDHALVIVDVSLHGVSGLELIKTLAYRYPGLALLVMSMHDESLYAERALWAGARGYIMKQEATQSILLAIRQVLRGDIYLSAAMHTRLLQRLVVPLAVVVVVSPTPSLGSATANWRYYTCLGSVLKPARSPNSSTGA